MKNENMAFVTTVIILITAIAVLVFAAIDIMIIFHVFNVPASYFPNVLLYAIAFAIFIFTSILTLLIFITVYIILTKMRK